MIKVLPASTGFGVSFALTNTGAPVSSVTLRVTVVLFPALSVATTVIVLAPGLRVMVLLHVPFSLTATFSPFTVTVTGLEVASSVVPDTSRLFADLF